ncbi:conserved protein, unknown function [Plasmodium sp. gorilla clade G2]|uniref:conserved protein, unknown function n=1 Tax=Plasmodium sp. gorilla clade G2 TaxID=880535 RepID=UPI000D2267DC|nr:conserved protein, unknown function [Plasmodium sp. gorilla clade G2]SOV16978.1 conserved protein, unknown function [Plasmodium sp. gorilla clade G2]
MKDNEFVGGKLKLKKDIFKKDEKKGKKQKKDKNNKRGSELNEKKKRNSEKEYINENNDPNKNIKVLIDGEDKLNDILNMNMTESEKAYHLVLKKREKQRIENILKESYRDRLQKFNDNLASLSEHFDIPKVGPG